MSSSASIMLVLIMMRSDSSKATASDMNSTSGAAASGETVVLMQYWKMWASVAVHMRFKLDVRLVDALGMAQEQIPSRFQVFVKALHQLVLAFFREINQNIHAKNAIELAHVHNLGQVHGSEGHHTADARLHHRLGAGSRKVEVALLRADRFQLARMICATLGVIESLPADVGGQDMDVPCIREFQRVSNSHGDAEGFFAGSAAGAPDAQRARALPKLLHVQFGQNFLFQRLKGRGIAEEGSLLRQQPLQQGVVFHVGVLNQANQIGSMGQLAGLYMLAHAAGEEAFARIVKEDARARLNQAPNLAQLVLADCCLHGPHPAALLRVNEPTGARQPPAPTEPRRDRHWRRGIATALRSVALTCAPSAPRCAPFAARPARSAA